MRTITRAAREEDYEPASRVHGAASADLLERDREHAAIGRCLLAAAAGEGGIVFVQAPAGGGKSQLLEAAGETARERGMQVLTAAGVELERQFPFALAMRLFDAPWLAEDAPEHTMFHRLFQSTQELAGPYSADPRSTGLAVLVDDLQWADGPSVRFLAYLTERLAKVPFAVVLAARTGEASGDPRALAALRRARPEGLLELEPLSADAVARAVRQRFPQAGEELCASCVQASGGNPFLLTELLRTIAEDDAPSAADAARIEELVPDAVRDSVAARLESLPAATRAVAEAVAVLEEDASVSTISCLSELDSEVVLMAAGRLSAAGLLAPEIPLSFAQPMIRTAVRASLAPFERAQAHLRAARILTDCNAGAELVAAHLLAAPPGRDPTAVGTLREAADASLRRGEPERAVCLVKRALAEHPGKQLRVELEAELDAADVIAMVISDQLERALEICDSARRAAGRDGAASALERINCAQAWAMYEQGRISEAQAAANEALRSARDGGDGYRQSTRALLARCHIERGELEAAESMLAAIELHGSSDSLPGALVLDTRAQVRLAQHRSQEALEDAMHAGALLGEQLSDASPGLVAWRSSAALALVALGHPHRALPLVEHELRYARRLGVTRVAIRDLRILGLAGPDRDRAGDALSEAVAIGGSHPSRLEYVRALIDHGAALRRSGRRADAREPLQLALDLSHRAGAGVLESRARIELIATGARPRRSALSGVGSLTVSQRRVAELAATGLTTREIASALFVTPKTVEFHLRHIYSKLDVSSRQALTHALSEDAGQAGAIPMDPRPGDRESAG